MRCCWRGISRRKSSSAKRNFKSAAGGSSCRFLNRKSSRFRRKFSGSKIHKEMNPPGTPNQLPLVSVVVVNYNCKQWLDRFFPSLREQTIFDRVEIIMVDNLSQDGSAEICEREMAAWPDGVFLQTGGNHGFGGGSNRGAKIGRGQYLLFLNPDVWLEKN